MLLIEQCVGLKVLTRETPVKTYDPETRKDSLNGTFKVLIAFALIERNENEASSASERSSKSVDMAQDNLDILRIHGIVQAFFVDVLADERLAHYWLGRAIRVFCHAFDESDRRIEEDIATGMPEDYLRFSIHGKRLLGYVDRFVRRYPELENAAVLLENRLDNIQLRIDQLNWRNKTNDHGSGQAPIVSVFERTNSLSEIDSSTPPSNSSLNEMPMYDESNAAVESPTVFSPTDHNPYHWHITFPYDVLSPDDGEISKTVTPQLAPTEVFDSISVPEDYETHSSHNNHRTIKRHSERRYRDTAGAWRASPQIVSDPRVSLSRESVKGFISPPSVPKQHDVTSNPLGSNRITASSDAEMTLNKIAMVAPPPARGTSGVGMTRTSSGGTTMLLRPKLIPGRPSYSDAHAETAVDDDYPIPTFSNLLGTSPAPSASYTAATLQRLKEQGDKPNSVDGLAPVKISSPLSAGPFTTGTSPPMVSPASATPSFNDVPDGGRSSLSGSRRSSGQPTRSARSSPANYISPFRPPPIEVEINATSSLYSAPGDASRGVRHATSYSRLEDNAIYEDEYEVMTHSVPSVRPYPPSRPPSPPYPHAGLSAQPLAVAIHPPPWTPADARPERHPQGYWSQPMSRDTSHQSSNSHGSARSQAARNRIAHVGSMSMQGAHTTSSSPGVQVMQYPASRRPSVVETEPSPRLGPAGFEMEPTSYQIFHESVRGRSRADSSGHYPGPVVQVVREELGRPGFFRRLSRRHRGGDTSAHHRRAESANGRLVRGGMERRLSPRGSPDPNVAGGTAIPARPGASAGHGEDMARSSSGSGGFRLADGSMVEFGSTPSASAEGSGSKNVVGLGISD
jgi:hypothetical protein